MNTETNKQNKTEGLGSSQKNGYKKLMKIGCFTEKQCRRIAKYVPQCKGLISRAHFLEKKGVDKQTIHSELLNFIDPKAAIAHQEELLAHFKYLKNNGHSSMRLFISKFHYPDGGISRGQCIMLNKALKQYAKKAEDEDIRAFQEGTFVAGALRLEVRSELALKWINSTVSVYPNPFRGSFKVFTSRMLPKSFKGIFPGGSDCSNTAILKALKNQNETIAPQTWELQQRFPVQSTNDVELRFLVGPESLKALEKANFTLQYQQHQVQMKRTSPNLELEDPDPSGKSLDSGPPSESTQNSNNEQEPPEPDLQSYTSGSNVESPSNSSEPPQASNQPSSNEQNPCNPVPASDIGPSRSGRPHASNQRSNSSQIYRRPPNQRGSYSNRGGSSRPGNSQNYQYGGPSWSNFGPPSNNFGPPSNNFNSFGQSNNPGNNFGPPRNNFGNSWNNSSNNQFRNNDQSIDDEQMFAEMNRYLQGNFNQNRGPGGPSGQFSGSGNFISRGNYSNFNYRGNF